MPLASRRPPDHALEQLAAGTPGLRLLVLHGSRARRDAHEHSDWDFAYEAEATLDPDGLLAMLAVHLSVDRIDLVDLARAGALLRFRVARDGVVVFEQSPRQFERFQLAAVEIWCDMAPILEPAYARILDTLPR